MARPIEEASSEVQLAAAGVQARSISYSGTGDQLITVSSTTHLWNFHWQDVA